ncbi:hypothetical protein K227x_24330 [Rubripirellula lacrimiformis]|uniref:Uncharacterized protein n=1 Tax=Rubripirellula lacrimiformis TaxID=1930273 RepID=A0A517NA90_9BACT|nr:hypothetical protein [Rubripirellula lacrimiformis]QDT04047.1 hypothetical protein K227x_24330 [Rubripirellula lacrimiformis]
MKSMQTTPLPRDLRRKANRRRGAAFFMLVLTVLLVIVGATSVMIRGVWTSRQATRDQRRVRTMESAIAAASRIAATELTLPVDPDSDQRIVVSMNDENDRYSATWLRGDQTIDQLTRAHSNSNHKEK